MNFIVALHPEARPIIERYGLEKRLSSIHFSFFENEKHRLIISGIGRINAAAATGYLLSQIDESPQSIINLGIAGHGNLNIGTPFIANRVIYPEEKVVHYPTPILDQDIERSALQTCNTPEKAYPQPIGYDMEAHTICSVAYKAVSRELVQIIKIVSDNPSNNLDTFDPKTATDLISIHLPLIDEIVESMNDIIQSISLDPILLKLVNKIQSSHHFTVTQSHQLRKVIQQAHVLGLNNSKITDLVSSCANAKDLIAALKKKLEPLRLLS